ncbi:cytochrome c oxidase subunit 3 [Paracoccus binzhouensis]|uniref:cytochrome c oxidase subunit 3 n=1 Tax=Paracoccus binzhouensis TaxID=2796149 RepID=UPI0018EF178A|nr:cytochrome c oxidase subunit 3 [Paracoccus binzhouensis]
MRLDDLPGELLMWVLILSELLVFAAGITVMAALRLRDPTGFAEAQALLDGRLAALNTVILVSSGYAAARAERAAARSRKRAARLGLGLAGLGGLAFLGLKAVEYAGDWQRGISMEASPFFTFYYLLTGFHAAHVIAGVALLALVAWRARPDAVQAGAMFWHMVDLVWVLILPPIYLLG